MNEKTDLEVAYQDALDEIDELYLETCEQEDEITFLTGFSLFMVVLLASVLLYINM